MCICDTIVTFPFVLVCNTTFFYHVTTGLPAFAESPKLSAKTSSRSATYLPRAALGKEPSAKHLPAKDSLPRAPLGKIFTESNVKALG